MSSEKEIIRRLKVELAALEAELEKQKRESVGNVKEALIAAALKHGTMVAPNVMELTVSSTIGARGNYDVTITYYPERNENTVRVRRI